MNRPDVEAVLAPLKPFQRRTVEHAFRQLFEDPQSTARFLVADEVGLGKTLVARGVIAKAIDHYWDEVDRIDVIYICSNQAIAHSNLPKLQVTGGGDKSFALATRLTMLATELAGGSEGNSLAKSKVNFVSFTPGTSFNMGDSGGMAKERRVLFALLDGLVEPRIGLMNLMQGYVTRTKWWRGRLKNRPMPLDPGIAKQFREKFFADQSLVDETNEVIEQWFFKMRKQYPPEARSARNRILGRLRRMLADICVQALEPDLIVLDEFQRFKGLLENRDDYADPAAELAQALFNAPTPEGHRTRTLLLSATPYKLYTADAEIEYEDHYQDFIDTTRFLYGGDESRVNALQQSLRTFGRELKQASQSLPHDVAAAKGEVERLLKAVMARTERVVASDKGDAMLQEVGDPLTLHPVDVRQYMAADALFRAVGDYDPLTFWKSAPYLPHFMHGYKFNERLTECLEQFPEKVLKVLKDHSGSMLADEHLDQWREIDPGNAKLREITRDVLDAGLWKLLWMPPTVPYWPLQGAYQGQDHRTKTLLFSAWNVVPDVISGLLSYEAERRMLGGSMDQYKNLSEQQSQLLDFGASNANRTRHRMLLLLTPCLRLADEAHPLNAVTEDVRSWVRGRVEAMLAELPDPTDGLVDERWESVILRLLDPGIDEFLAFWRDTEFDPEDPLRPEAANFEGHVQDLLEIDASSLGRRPDDLGDLVTELALGAPGVLAARTIASANLDDQERRRQAVRLANSFWKLFNRPAVIKLLRQLAESNKPVGESAAPYWRLVIEYCLDGNLQAVLDEYWHLIWEQHAWSQREEPATISLRCVHQMRDTIEPRSSRVHASFYKANGQRVEEQEIRLRTVLALRFGRAKYEEGNHSQNAVRGAFNSPFRPFVLASTSVGQEGLDFHPWCHRLVHWDLPGNPVDMEQREGRVHRYKGHAVRRNVAQHHANGALGGWALGQNLWDLIFQHANEDARAKKQNDLIPHWLAPGAFTIERSVPLLPYTREVEAFKRLKRQLAAYRVVFGQPRQEELLNLLDQSDIDIESLKDWQISLEPPEN
ncbi:MAG: helicase-related protein [Xanthomonadales bacterium]|nr:helicase-related protein [Xanthomonadales bacterium]